MADQTRRSCHVPGLTTRAARTAEEIYPSTEAIGWLLLDSTAEDVVELTNLARWLEGGAAGVNTSW